MQVYHVWRELSLKAESALIDEPQLEGVDHVKGRAEDKSGKWFDQ